MLTTEKQNNKLNVYLYVFRKIAIIPSSESLHSHIMQRNVNPGFVLVIVRSRQQVLTAARTLNWGEVQGSSKNRPYHWSSACRCYRSDSGYPDGWPNLSNCRSCRGLLRFSR